EQFIEIFHLKVDHERLFARREIVSIARKWRPDGATLALRIIQFPPFTHRGTFLLHLDFKVRAIPFPQFIWIVRLEENTADAADTFHSSKVEAASCRLVI